MNPSNRKYFEKDKQHEKKIKTTKYKVGQNIQNFEDNYINGGKGNVMLQVNMNGLDNAEQSPEENASSQEDRVIKGQLGVNKQQLISLLGSTMYKQDV